MDLVRKNLVLDSYEDGRREGSLMSYRIVLSVFDGIQEVLSYGSGCE